MALITPDYLQTKTYAAKRDRRVNQALVMQEGIVNAGDFKVAQRGAGANMSVDVAAGESWVDGDSSIDQGYYHVVNDATVNVAIANNASGNPRIDTLVLKVNDSADAGSGTDTPALEIIQGTPTPGATLANLSGIAALSNTALRLAYILVANGAVKIENASIGNLVDPREGVAGYPALEEPKARSLAPAQYAHGRPLGYVPAAEIERTANQSVANTTNVAITWPTEQMDNDGMHVAAASAFTVQTPGVYQITFAALWNATLIGELWFNNSGRGNELFRYGPSTASMQRMGIAGTTRAGFGDVIELFAWQNSGSEKLLTGKAAIVWQGP